MAIKRAEYGSKQGALEFKNEIELLSRVHHKNLLSLIGFCYEQGDQMLVYEYVSNGTLRQNLQGMYTQSNNYKSKSVMFFLFLSCFTIRNILMQQEEFTWIGRKGLGLL